MLNRFCLIVAASGLTFVLLVMVVVHAVRSEQANSPVIIVAASYPGASADEVADAVAAPIEAQLKGLEGMVRMESESGNDGKYIARLYSVSKMDLKLALELVENRVTLVGPILPNVVKMNGVSVKVGRTEADQGVAIALLDRQNQGWEALGKCAGAVLKRLTSEGAIRKATTFPVDAKQVYRVNLLRAMRITGIPPDGRLVDEAATTCVKMAEVEMKRIHCEGFAVENLSGK